MESGRDKFQKHKTIIKAGVWFFSLFSNKINMKLLETFRDIKGYKGLLIRYILVKNITLSCGDNVSIHPNVYFFAVDNISLGNNVSIHPMCYIDATGEIYIGDDVSIAHGTSILSTNHSWKDHSLPIKYNAVTSSRVHISNDVWIGCGCRILSGITIESRVVVAAGAVVTTDVYENTIVGGIPAKEIKTI